MKPLMTDNMLPSFAFKNNPVTSSSISLSSIFNEFYSSIKCCRCSVFWLNIIGSNIFSDVHREPLLFVVLPFFLRFTSTLRLVIDSLFWQSTHLQFSPQRTLSWKHSQYFLTQKDLRQEHPFGSLVPSCLMILLVLPLFAAFFWRCACSLLFWFLQSQHRHNLLHSCLAAKHSQYSFMHLEFLQLQNFYSCIFSCLSLLLISIFKFK